MAKPPRASLSASQQEIMEIVWERGEASAFEVRQVLQTRRPITRETVRTLLARMEEKGWLEHRVVGRTFFYGAAIPREVNLGQRVLDLVDTLCGGSAEKLVNALLDHRELTEEEADRIQAKIDVARKKSPTENQQANQQESRKESCKKSKKEPGKNPRQDSRRMR